MNPGLRLLRRTAVAALATLMAACASAPPLSPYRAEALVTSLATACTAEGAAGAEAVPEGLAVVRSEGADLVMVAAGSCVLTIDPANGRVEPLTLRGALAMPTMLDASSEGVALSSRATGATLRIHLGETTTTEQLSGFQDPHGVRLLPGGGILVAERSAGRVLRVGPSEESRPVTVIENLQGPIGLVVANATTGYVSEREAGRITRFSPGTGERATVAGDLRQPEGMALLADRRLAVAETGLRRLLAIDTATGAREVLADNLPIADPAGSAAITDVAVGPDGAIYVSSDLERTVLRLTRRP